MFDPQAARRTVYELVAAAAHRLSARSTDACVCGDTYAQHQPKRMSVWLGHEKPKPYNGKPSYVRRECTLCDCTIYTQDTGGDA